MAEGRAAGPDGPLLEAVAITKRFAELTAVDAVDLEVYPSRIHALLGENGAGKSTLVKMIYGLLAPTSGELRFAGRTIELARPADARALGIGMVFQHFSLFDNLTVAENVALGLDGDEPLAALTARLADLSRAYGLPLEPNRPLWRLSIGERQRVEIVRVLLQDPKLVILDEPTAVLTPQEAEQLFITLERLRDEGRAILYISHKLEEVKRLCDTATVLRGGRRVATCDPRRETAASLAAMMVGTAVKDVRHAVASERGAPRLVVGGLNLPPLDSHGVALVDVALEVRGGEIVGIAGVAGNGQDELFAALSGECPAPPGAQIAINGAPVGQASITERRRLGAAFVPDERLGHAAAPRLRLSENALISGHAAGHMTHHGFVDRRAMLACVDKVSDAFDVRKAKRDPEAASLSGGNLQKFVVGREILREPGVLVVRQPTWGVDAGAAATIRQALVDLAARGSAVLVISQDLDELEEIADRIAVIYRGRLTEPHSVRTIDRASIGLMMGGAAAQEPGAAHASDA
jgi:simple sugar transport system ATP-binding protein